MTTPTRFRPSLPPVEVDPDILRTEIPPCMQEAPRWLLYRLAPPLKPGKKPRKIPHYATTGTERKGTLDTPEDTAELVTLDAAIAALARFPGYGIGFALGPCDDSGDYWQGVDLDNLSLHPEWTTILDMAPGYREWSPSRDGYHILGRGKDFATLPSNESGVEAYCKRHFFTFTGWSLGDYFDDLEPFVTKTLKPIHRAKARARPSAPPPAPAAIALTPDKPQGEEYQRRLGELREALACISPENYGTWIAMGHALKELGADGFALWDNWSQGSDKYQAAEMAGRWAGFNPERTGPAAVFAEAQRHGWVNPASREARRQATQAGWDGQNFSEKVIDPFDPFESLRLLGSDPSGTPSGDRANPFGQEGEKGFLLEERDLGKRGKVIVRKVDSIAAEEIALRIRGWIALDRESETWHLWEENYWQPQHTLAKVEKNLSTMVARGTDWMGYKDCYMNGIVAVIRKRDMVAKPPPPPGTVPFKNGLLDLTTMALKPSTPDFAHDWVIPHEYDPRAKCPRFLAWITEAVDEDLATVELLRAWMAAGLLGVFVQKILFLYGRGGTGKSTFGRLYEMLLGFVNVAHTTIKALEEGRFELARLVGKRLVHIGEAGKHGGNVNNLKKLSGGEPVPVERKHTQQHGSYTYGGLILITSNDLLQSTDTTSGLERRRLQVTFNRTATPEEREDWRRRGGEEGVLHTEIPGIVNWLLELREADIHRIIESPSRRVLDDNIAAMTASNAVAAWLVSCTRPVPWNGTYSDPNHTQVGSGNSRLESGARVYTDDPGSRAYPSYLKFCDETKRVPTSLPRFVSTVVDISEQLGHRIKHGKHASGRYGALFGLRLRQDWEEAFNWSALADGPIQP